MTGPEPVRTVRESVPDGSAPRASGAVPAGAGAPGGAPSDLLGRISLLLRCGGLQRLRPCSLDYGQNDQALLRRALRQADRETLEGLAATSNRETVRASALAALGDVDGLLVLARTARRREAVRLAIAAVRILDPEGNRRRLDSTVRTLQDRLRETAPE